MLTVRHNFKTSILRNLLLLLLGLLILNSCGTKTEYFPKKSDILVSKLEHFDNFFPIATLDLTEQGITDPIHIIYLSLDPFMDDHFDPFPNDDHIDNFSFVITKNGKLDINFGVSALNISQRFKEEFNEDLLKFSKYKKTVKRDWIIDFPIDPVWWQDDETPLSSKGNKMRFVCQVDIGEILSDDCRMFVFYDESDRVIKNIYQRD